MNSSASDTDSAHQEAGSRCPECGAPVAAGTACRDSFHALLAYEWAVPGGPGELAHFYAVASYGLQHPRSMGFTVETAVMMRDTLAEVLAGTLTLEQTRGRVRAGASAGGRITRRGDEAVPDWSVVKWPIVVTEVLPEDPSEYLARVEAWARSVVETVGVRNP